MRNFRQFYDFIFRKNIESGGEAREPMVVQRPRPKDRNPSNREPRFRTSATDRSGTGDVARSLQRIREAFLPTQPVTSRAMFAGRQSLLANLIEAVEDQRAHLVLHGQRGIGKTSLLRVLKEAAEEADYLVIHENCGAATKFDSLFRNIAGRVPLRYNGSLSPAEAQAQAEGTLADLLERNAGPREVSQLFSQLAGTRCIIVLDEFDRARAPQFKADIAEFIKNLSDASARVQLIISGVGQNLHELLGHSPSIRRNVLAFAVGRLTDDEVSVIVELGERHAGLKFDAAARAAIVKYSHGFPYVGRLLSHLAALRSMAVGKRSVTTEEVSFALQHALSDLDRGLEPATRSALAEWIRSDPAKMRELLNTAFDATGSISAEEIASRCGGSEQEAKVFLDGVASTGFLANMENGHARYELKDQQGMTGYLLLATAAHGEGPA